MLKRLRIQFICIIMGIVTLMLLLIFALILHFTKQDLKAESLTMMQTIAAPGKEPDRPGDHRGELRLPYFILERDADGRAHIIGGSEFDLSDEAFVEHLMQYTGDTTASTGQLPEYDLRYYRAPSHNGTRTVFVDISSEESAMQSLIRTCLLIGICALFIFFLMSLFLSRMLLRPVELAWSQQKQFVADASHELKTPLTVIMTNAELLQDPACTNNDRAQFSQNILTTSYRMRDLTAELLELARLDDSSGEIPTARLELGPLIEDAALPFEALFFERGLELCVEAEPGIFVQGNASYLQRLAEVFLDNAQKYSAPQGTVTVRLSRSNRLQCVLTVSNPGDPLTDQQISKLFERFYRADQARSASGSYGLGLPIAAKIVSAHNGRIHVESCCGLNRFSVVLPTCH